MDNRDTELRYDSILAAPKEVRDAYHGRDTFAARYAEARHNILFAIQEIRDAEKRLAGDRYAHNPHAARQCADYIAETKKHIQALLAYRTQLRILRAQRKMSERLFGERETVAAVAAAAE